MRWCHSPSSRSLVLSGATFFLLGRRFYHVPLCWRASGYDQWSWDGCFCWQKVRSGKQASTNQTERSRKCASECLSMKKSHALESTRQRLQTQRPLASPLFQHPIPHIKRPIVWSQRWCFQWSSAYIHHGFWVVHFFQWKETTQTRKLLSRRGPLTHLWMKKTEWFSFHVYPRAFLGFCGVSISVVSAYATFAIQSRAASRFSVGQTAAWGELQRKSETGWRDGGDETHRFFDVIQII